MSRYAKRRRLTREATLSRVAAAEATNLFEKERDAKREAQQAMKKVI